MPHHGPFRQFRRSPQRRDVGFRSERNLLFADSVIGGSGSGSGSRSGEREGLGGERGGRSLKFEGSMMNREQRVVPEV